MPGTSTRPDRDVPVRPGLLSTDLPWHLTVGVITAAMVVSFTIWSFGHTGSGVNPWMLLLAIAFGLFMAFNIGGNDVANSFGTSVGAGTLTMRQALAVAAIFDALEEGGAKVLSVRDPAVLAKAIKNPVEISGHKAAQARDGAAIVRFLKWCEETLPAGETDELTAAAKLKQFREATGALKDISFDTISATGAHGASPHYKVTQESNARIERGQLYLVDSGGQYQDGTTDITRVVPVGAPTAEMRDRFTRVLKGHIAIDTARFPEGVTGGQIDGFARAPLWEVGLDYAHGTGHGVGAYLSVHEGPQRIAAPNYPGGGPAEPLRAGMILSNEPGYYKAGEYGIRIENLILTVPIDVPGAEKPVLGFETLTFAPIERDLIEPSLLTDREKAWLDAYHAKVLALIGPQLDAGERAWLEAKCAPIG